jgi:hypothetical protein
MSGHVRDYHQASEKILTVPLELTERDFAVLHEFGGPQEERRGRDAQRQAQLALVTPPAPPVRTRALDPPPRARGGLRPEVLGALVGQAIRGAVEPLRRTVRDQATAIQALQQGRAEDQATIRALQQARGEDQAARARLEDAHKALGQLVADTQRPVLGPAHWTAIPARRMD